jgi:Skp family chaperone for outer membrane proteins
VKTAISFRRVVIGAGVMVAVMLMAAPVRAQEPAGGGYKIGVVNMREVFQNYDRQKAEYEKLKQKQESAQAEIDKISDRINEAKKRYEADKATMTRDAREQFEINVSKDFSNYQAEFKKLQDDIDLQERKLLKDLFQEITTAVQEVGAADNYHLILEAGSDGNAAVLYYATPLNLTSKVIDHLNNKAR